LPPDLTAKELPGGQTQILTVRQVRTICHHPVQCGMDSRPEILSDTENSLNWNRHLQNPNCSIGDCVADIESEIVQDNQRKHTKCAELQDVSATPNVAELTRPTQM